MTWVVSRGSWPNACFNFHSSRLMQEPGQSQFIVVGMLGAVEARFERPGSQSNGGNKRQRHLKRISPRAVTIISEARVCDMHDLFRWHCIAS